jgi:hypothetical protein
VYQFPVDWAYSFFTSVKGNFGKPNDLFMTWLRSGAANSTIQRELTPGAFRTTLGLPQPMDFRRLAQVPHKAVLDNVARFSNAIEETSKILGLKRGMRFEGIDKLPPAKAAEKLQEIAVEVRNYSGSPDFLRKGQDTTGLNLLFMFANARIQGTAADLTRLAGKTGTKEAGAAWARLGATVGVPATILAVVNQSDKYREDYLKVSEWERRNYFMIPRDSFFTNDQGEQVRDYWRIPKREIVSLFGNLIESAVDFARQHDPKALATFATDALETVSPVNIQGKTATERLESAVSSLNPLAKVPIELATGRDTFRHRQIVPSYMEKAPAAEQYRHTTPPAFVKGGQALGVSPLKLEQAARGATAELVTQFAPRRPEPGRSAATTNPILRRFIRSSSVAGEDDQAAVSEAEQKETGEQVRRRRTALEHLEDWKRKNVPADARRREIAEIRRQDPKLAAKMADLQTEQDRGITYLDRQVLQLGVESGARAEYIRKQLARFKSDLEREVYLRKLREKKILTPRVEGQLRGAGQPAVGR